VLFWPFFPLFLSEIWYNTNRHRNGSVAQNHLPLVQSKGSTASGERTCGELAESSRTVEGHVFVSADTRLKSSKSKETTNYEQPTTNLVSQDTISSDESRATCDGYALYIYRESSTNSPLFMQNKPNFLDALMNVTSFYTVDYENKSNWRLGENKANTKPKQTQFAKCPNRCKFSKNKEL